MTVAAACAEQFAQVAVVELASVRDPDAAVPLVASALDVEQRQHLTLARTIEEFIQDRAVLLVLDNCEHVLDAVVPLVQRLYRQCPRLTVLATGREPLGLPGESVHLLEPLRVPAAGAGHEARPAAAVELFAERAAEARPDSGSTTAPWRRSWRSAGGWRVALGDRAGRGEDALDRRGGLGGPPRSALLPPRRPAGGHRPAASQPPRTCRVVLRAPRSRSSRRPSPISLRSPAVSTSTPPRPCAARPAPHEEARRGW